jgi:hypothetical protein
MKDKRTGRIGKERHPMLLQLIHDGKTAVEIADLMDLNQETVRKFARTRNLVIVRHDQSLEKHPAWKGGTTCDRSGYILQRVYSLGEHGYLIRANTRNDRNGYAPVHRIVMHDKLGRALEENEVVDHIDGNVKNNHPDNLRLFQSNAEHLKETLKGKIPNWTPEGFSRMNGRPNKSK